MGGGADVSGGVVEDEVFEVDEFAVDLQRGAGVGEILAFDPPLPDGSTRNSFIEASKGTAGVGNRPQQGTDGEFSEIVSHCFYGKGCPKRKVVGYCGSSHGIKKPPVAHRR